MTFTYITRPNKTGGLNVYLQYIHDEKRLAKSTGITIGKKNWNPTTKCFVKVKTKDKKLIEAQMNSLKDFVTELEKKKESVSVQNVKNEFKLYNQAKNKIIDSGTITGLVEGFRMFVERHQNEREKNTLDIYKLVLNNIIEFESKYDAKINLTEIDEDFKISFSNFLYQKNLLDTTVGLRFKTLKTALYWLDEKAKLKVNQAYKKFKVNEGKREAKRSNKVHLTIEELELFKNATINDLSQEIYKDLFVFQCNTGLAISDITRISKKHIKDDCIDMTRFKTQKEIFVPLNKDAKELLEKYDYNFPSVTEQVYNRNIKKIASKAGIESEVEFIKFKRGKKEITTKFKHEVLSSHHAVKTFITIAADRGFTVSEISEMTSKTEEIILNNYLGKDRKGLKAKMKNKW